MKKYIPINDNILVTSRGVDVMAGLIEVPEQYLRDSNVCTTEDGQTIIVLDNTGYELSDHRRIIKKTDVIAKIIDGKIKPIYDWVLVRKCIDKKEALILPSRTGNSSRFAEILAVGPDTMLEGEIGQLGYIAEGEMQKVEETEADWLIRERLIQFIVTED